MEKDSDASLLKEEVSRANEARKKMKEERDGIEKKLFEVQGKLADHNAVLSRLERELALGSTSPMDWDRAKKGDFVERVVNAFKTKSCSDASLKSAHEALIKQHQNLAAQFEASKQGYTLVAEALESFGMKRDASAPEIAKFVQEHFVRERVKYDNFSVLPEEGKKEKPGVYHAHVSAPERGDIHIHLHIV